MKYYHRYENEYLRQYLKGSLQQKSTNNFQSLFDKTWGFLDKEEQELKILEWGCGTASLFESVFHCNQYDITAIDISKTAIDMAKRFSENEHIKYLDADLTLWGRINFYDLIIDAHAIGCLALQEDFSLGLDSAVHSLVAGGVFSFEIGVFHNELWFSDQYMLIDQTLYKHKKNRKPFATRFIPSSQYVEDLLLSKGLDILYFKIDDSRNIIYDYDVDAINNPQLLTVVCKKRVSS